ncbi:MAG: ribosome-associated translation inhibitor RaiA [Planctomycetes bacterium]|nr:ribosome-associated translation inhibitor RaiA [Planctomycetota bacterium]
MNTIVKARHMEVTDAMRQHIESKLSKLPRYYDRIVSIEVTLDVQADQSLVEIVVKARRRHTFVASHRTQDMYTCVDLCLGKITEQIRRHKDKVRNRHASPTSQAVAEKSADQ